MTVRGKHTSKHQKEHLVELMSININLANDRFSSLDGRSDNKNLWTEISVKLNAVGGAQKDGEKWRKTWVDMKKYVRTTFAKQKELLNRTGLGIDAESIPIPRLEGIDEKILQIITTHSVDGDGETSEGGFIVPTPITEKSPIAMQTPTHPVVARSHNTNKVTPIIRGSARSRDKILDYSNKIEKEKVTALNRIAAAMEERNNLIKQMLNQKSTKDSEAENIVSDANIFEDI